LSFQRVSLITNPFIKRFTFGPNLDIIPKVSAAYEQAANEDLNYHDHILSAHRNFLRDAVYFLYVHNRIKDAANWFKYMCEHYPNKALFDGNPKSLPGTVTLDEYAVGRVQEDVTDTNARDRIKAIIEGLIATSYENLAMGDNEQAAGYALLAEKVRTTYQSKIKQREEALYMEPLDDIKREVLNRLLDTTNQVAPFEMRAALRTKLGMPPEQPATTTPSQPGSAQPASASDTNSVPENVSSK
jgi:hypothetical protein